MTFTNDSAGAGQGATRRSSTRTTRRPESTASRSSLKMVAPTTSTVARGVDFSTSGIRIPLPLVPPKQMSHNARSSRWSTTRISKKHREDARKITEKALAGVALPVGVDFKYDLEVYWGKGRLRCDEDGLASMMKPVLDGIADALGTTSDRKLHIGTFQQGRAPSGRGWMTFTLSVDERNHDCGKREFEDEYLPEAA